MTDYDVYLQAVEKAYDVKITGMSTQMSLQDKHLTNPNINQGNLAAVVNLNGAVRV